MAETAPDYVLDSYALLAYFQAEPGGLAVRALLEAARPEGDIAPEPDERRRADAFAAALAQELGATLVTGDPEFKSVESQLAVMWLQDK